MTADGELLAVLMALRVKGRATASVVAASAGVSRELALAGLEAACGRGEAARGGGASDAGETAYRLTEAGREEVAALIAAQTFDRTALAALYDEFLPVDATLKERISAWQLRSTERQGAGAPADLRAAGESALALAERLARVVPRLATYTLRLRAAIEAVAGGDDRFVASPRVDSLHQVWFELHEELLLALGRTRAPDCAGDR